MTTLADKSLLSGGDNKPPMLEKHLYDSWKSRMELYMMNRPHGRMILASVEKGPLVWPSITMDGVTRLKEYTELTPAEAIQADCDIKAINIILQGLPTEIYALVSQHRVAKDLWRRGNCSTQGTSITKQEREFNTKFLNTLPDEMDQFVTDVKLVKDLHTTNVDQLHAYLEQHERHANEVLTYPSNDFQSSIHHNIYSPSSSIPQLEYPPQINQQSEFSQQDSGLIVPVFQKGDDPIDAINHMMSFLTAVVTSRYPTTNNQLRNSSNPRQQATINNGRVTLQPIQGRQTSFAAGTSRTYTPGASGSNSGKQRTRLEITTDKQYHSLFSYVIESQQATGSDSNSSAQQDDLILSVIEQLKTQVANCTKTNLENKSVNDTLTAELERYKEQVKVLKEGQNVDLRSKDNVSDTCAQSVEIDLLKQTLSEHLKEKESLLQTVTLLKNDFKKEESRNIDREIALEKQIKHLDNIVFKRDQSAQTVHMLTKPQFFYDNTTKQALGFQNPFYLQKAQQSKPKLYVGDIIVQTNPIVIPDSEETLALAEESRSKMLLKHKDNMMLEKEKENSANSSEPTLSIRPTNVEVPIELPKVSMVNTSLKKLKHHLANFNVVVKERTTPTAITEGLRGFEHTKACFRDEIIPFVKALKDLFSTFNQHLVDELSEVQNVFYQMEQAVEQHRIESKTFEVKSQEKDTIIKKLKERIKSLSGKIDKDKIKQDLEEIEIINIELDHRVTKLIAKNEHLKQTYKQLYDSIKPARIRSKEQCDDLINQVNIKSAEISDLNASLQEKALAITALKDELRKLKGKALVDNNVSNHPSDPELHQVNVEPITPKLLNKRTAHSAYIKHSQEEAAVLRDLVDHIKANYPLDPLLESALKQSTNASGSQPSGNTKKDKIQQTQSRILKNKVEAHPRKVKSSLKNKDHVVEPKGTAPVQHSKLNANSNLKCVKCNGCMLSDNHDLYVLDFINNVNARAKSRSVKQSSKRKVWKPTGKDYTTTEVPLRKSSTLDNKTPKPVVTLVYSRKTRKSKTSIPVNNYKVIQIILWYLDSGCSKHMIGDRSQLTNFVNKFLGIVKFDNDHVAKIMGYRDNQIGNVTISRVYYVEGLGHNLFSVG
ncbi:hypothetical protein Tco_1041202 [Tanacetum coccineum]|uniref:Retrovirus-related Pol polyprotein from transposon TNT 1-94-like beta-barrel domain-containing protein n=1 Tax=Tanacetum coccineum TaxID=301880 RepID=A0ABQ5GFG9_9ASTR